MLPRPTEPRPSLRPIALASTAVFSACQMMAFVLYPSFAESTGLSLAEIISSFSVGSFLFLWGSPYWARKSESWGRRPVLAVGLLGLLISQAALLIMMQPSQPFAAILLWGSRILYGLTACAIVPVSQAIMADRSAVKDRMKAMTRHSMSLHIGRLLGPLLVWLGLMISAATPLWLCTILLFGLSFMLFFIAEPVRLQGPQSLSRRWYWPASPQSRRLIIIAFGVTCLVGILQSSLTKQLQTVLQLDAHAAAQFTLRFLLASSAVTVLIQALVQAKIKNPWQGTFPIGAFCLLLSSLLLWRFQTARELWWALPLFAAGLALITPSYTAALSLHESPRQGEAAGLLGVAHTLGYTVGGFLTAGLMALHIAPMGAALFVSLLLLLAVFTLKARAESQHEPESALQPYTREQA